MTYSYYVIVFTSIDYYTYYEGSIQVTARTQKEAIKLARKKLVILDYIKLPEVIYGPFNRQAVRR